MSEARRNRRIANRKFAKESAFISKIDIPDTYVKLFLNLDHGLTKQQKSVFLLYIERRRKLDQGFNELIRMLDELIEKSIKNKLEDTTNEESFTNS